MHKWAIRTPGVRTISNIEKIIEVTGLLFVKCNILTVTDMYKANASQFVASRYMIFSKWVGRYIIRPYSLFVIFTISLLHLPGMFKFNPIHCLTHSLSRHLNNRTKVFVGVFLTISKTGQKVCWHDGIFELGRHSLKN